MIFTEGFENKGQLYGWNDGELYRLPSSIHGGVNEHGIKVESSYYNLNLLKLKEVTIAGNKTGRYFIDRKQWGKKKLKEITETFDTPIEI